MEPDLQRPDDHRCGHRPTRPPRRHPRDERHQRARRPSQERTQGGQRANDNYNDNYVIEVNQGGGWGNVIVAESENLIDAGQQPLRLSWPLRARGWLLAGLPPRWCRSSGISSPTGTTLSKAVVTRRCSEH